MTEHITEQLKMEFAPVKLCECGCGRQVPSARRFLPGHHPLRPTEELFWKKVDKRGPDDCWNWTASRYTSGYGQFWAGTHLVGAHRFSYELHNGPIPEELQVCHRCDNRLCVNPAHLWLGTAQDNITDMHEKGRNGQPKGERQRSAKFTNEQVRHIRQMYANGGRSYDDLAQEFGVHRQTMYAMLTGRTYRNA